MASEDITVLGTGNLQEQIRHELDRPLGSERQQMPAQKQHACPQHVETLREESGDPRPAAPTIAPTSTDRGAEAGTPAASSSPPMRLTVAPDNYS